MEFDREVPTFWRTLLSLSSVQDDRGSVTVCKIRSVQLVSTKQDVNQTCDKGKENVVVIFIIFVTIVNVKF
jgi:hypothetical protein